MDFKLTKEQRDIIKAAREFALGEFPERAQQFDREESFDYSLHKKACELGFVGVFIDEEYGGAGLGYFEHCLISEEFWSVDPGIGLAILSTTFGAELLLRYGTEEQKREILPKLVRGEAILGTAITEPDAGSDVSSAKTVAELKGGDWVINGSKIFITNGTVADYLLVFCLTDPEAERHRRHSVIIVPTDVEGFEAEKIRGKMGVRASDTAEISFRDVKVPKENLVGKRGEGFRQIMEFLNITRVHVAAQAVGLARGAYEEAVRYVKQREQFGKKLMEYQVTQFKLAEMATMIRAARNLYWEAAWKIDNGGADPVLSAMAKWYAGKVAVMCADEAVQLHGGYGYKSFP